MAHITVPDGLPGILGPMAFRPETAKPLNDLVEVLLRDDNTLSRGDRELIASYVSKLNDCHFCSTSHGGFAALQLDAGWDIVDQVWTDLDSAPVTPKMRALLALAAQVQQGGKTVTDADVAAARAEGATDTELHDTVLIAAAFCMYNRYVDGLGTWAPAERADYAESAQIIVEHGYHAFDEAPDHA